MARHREFVDHPRSIYLPICYKGKPLFEITADNYEKYKDKVDLVIDGGYGDNTASTVVDCTTGEFQVLRQGKGDLTELV